MNSVNDVDTVDCTIYLSRPVELKKQACLTGKQVLPEIELRHAVATHHTAACLTPGGLQNLSHIITICLATCNMGTSVTDRFRFKNTHMHHCAM